MTEARANDLATWACLPAAFTLAWIACGVEIGAQMIVNAYGLE